MRGRLKPGVEAQGVAGVIDRARQRPLAVTAGLHRNAQLHRLSGCAGSARTGLAWEGATPGRYGGYRRNVESEAPVLVSARLRSATERHHCAGDRGTRALVLDPTLNRQALSRMLSAGC